MKCPKCGSSQQSVIDTRSGGDTVIRRKRQCTACGNRWNTLEGVAGSPSIRILEELEELKTLREENARLTARLNRSARAIGTALDTLRQVSKEEQKDGE